MLPTRRGSPRRPALAVAVVLCGVAIAVVGACRQAEPPNLLLVTFDTTRWDRVGWGGGAPGVTPMLDAMADRGVTFTTASSVQPLTLPSHTSIMTGRYPFRHGVRNNGTYVVPEEELTLAERLRDAGYATHAVVSAFVLDSQFGLDQGFVSYDDDLAGGPRQKMFMFKETTADRTVQRAVRWLREERPADRPFFLWLHFFDPHADYEPPADVAARFPDDPYSAEIHFADRELGRVFAELSDTNLLDRTLLVFTSDHGDGLGDHREKTHGIFVYDDTTRVPLLLAGPGVPSGVTVDTQVRTVDLVPTLIDLLGLPADDAELDGESLRPLWEDPTARDDAGRVAYIETLNPLLNFGWSELRALRSDRYKVIDAPRPEGYDVAADPGETTNLLAGDDPPSGLRRLRAELRQVVAADPFERGDQRPDTLDAESRDKLAALGYVWSATPAAGDRDGADPKDRIVYWERFQEAQALIRDGRYDEAVATLEALLAEDAENVIAMGSLANALAQSGDEATALAVYRRMIALDPGREEPYLGAAKLLTARGELAEARQLALAVQEMQPRNPAGYVALGDVELAAGRFAAAEAAMRRAIALDPTSSSVAAALGNALHRAGELAEAYEVLVTAYRHDPTSHTLVYNLAVVSDRAGKRRQAYELYRKAVELEPGHSMSWNNLGSLLDKAGQRQRALQMIAKAHQLDPTNLEAAYNLGVMLLASDRAAEALELFDHALALQPKFAPAVRSREEALRRVGRQQ